MESYKSKILTLVQYATMAYLIFALPIITKNPITFSIQLMGFVLGMWAIVIMSRSKLNITPVPRDGAILINVGPYRFVRHPMYLSLLLVFVPTMIINISIVGWIAFGVFLINLILKLYYEEKLLIKTFKGYKDYQQHTWRLIPWVY